MGLPVGVRTRQVADAPCRFAPWSWSIGTTSVSSWPSRAMPHAHAQRRGSASTRPRSAVGSRGARRSCRQRLFDRTPEGYLLTASGQDLLTRAEAIENEALALERTLVGADLRLAAGGARGFATERACSGRAGAFVRGHIALRGSTGKGIRGRRWLALQPEVRQIAHSCLFLRLTDRPHPVSIAQDPDQFFGVNRLLAGEDGGSVPCKTNGETCTVSACQS